LKVVRTYKLSKPAVKRLAEISKETGLSLSAIIDRLILGLPIGTNT
jgi:hypothetical protein